MQDHRNKTTIECDGPLAVEGPQPDSRLATRCITEDLIAYIVEKIVLAVSPRKIILFGSRSRGQATESSDLDLLVIDDSGRSSHQVRREIEHVLWGRRFAVDLLVATPEQVERNVSDGNPFYTRHILVEGKVLYERGSGVCS
jgi:predicted nucleotidyltransferase